MAIWSLTQERVEKLLNQIGDKEEEITILTALSPKDLWNKDLDDFIAEWRFQLDDDAKRQKKVASMGRRASGKLKLGAKGPGAKKRKAMGDDPDDSDFAASKSKKMVVAKKAPTSSKPFEYLKVKLPTVSKPATNGGNLKPLTKPNLEFDGSSDPMEIASDVGVTKAADSNKSERPKGRQGRATAPKTFKYAGLSDSDSDGEDMLGDVSKMVKGIGSGNGAPTPGSRPLFSTSMSRPGSSAGLPKAAPKSKRVLDISDDETDFSKLVPQSSPRKSLSTNMVRTMILSDDEDSMTLSPEKPITKSKKAPAKSVAKPALKPAPAVKAKSSAPKTAATKTQAARPAKGKKAIESEDEDEMDVRGIDDSDDDETSPPQAAVARPARRTAAATRKPVYLDSEDEGGEDDSEDFDESE
jgi:DNA topoisomerase-2